MESEKQVSKMLDGFPDLGTVGSHLAFISRDSQLIDLSNFSRHAADVFGGGVMTGYLIRFINTLDPNGSSSFKFRSPGRVA